MHVDLIGTYSKSIRQQYPGGAIIKNNVILILKTMIEPATCWFEIVKVMTYDIAEVMGGNDVFFVGGFV